ncbi:MAG: discoidin domain-containing protein [Phycisphaerae bacterium]|nr:discoidin domain-containing protein [Phycisphaerae bacterium]
MAQYLIVLVAAAGLLGVAAGDGFSGQIEGDWLRQAVLRGPGPAVGGNVTPESDAAGGVDGVIDGKWGFHTQQEANPWWQVDLREATALGRVELYNRTELAGRNSRIMVLAADDDQVFRRVYQHDGGVFLGHSDGKPLRVELDGLRARYVRVQLPGTDYLHLDEVEVYAQGGETNIALNKPSTQSSTSQWSVNHVLKHGEYPVSWAVKTGLALAGDLADHGVDVDEQTARLKRIQRQAEKAGGQDGRGLYLAARAATREIAFANPLLDFDSILFVKRAPGMFPHMSDQYYGWWSRPGGGIYILEHFKSADRRVRCLTADWPAGNFLRPDISYDGKRVVFAYCRYYPQVADMEKVDKERLPEDAFYNLYEMNIDGTGLRRLTRGRYDDFDARYLPNGEIVFLSTRKGTFLQVGKASAEATLAATLPDSYVRCGGDNVRPVPVYTLHVMDGDGGGLRAISAFENFEWTPSVAHDGRILYARWDYIDRFNGHFMSLWSTNPDGTNGQLVYGNYTTKPQCIFEARAIPGSNKLVFTAAAHHSNMGGALVLLDRSAGSEYERPLRRITPEVVYPEAEGWPDAYYLNPWPLSEAYFLTAWSDRRLPPHYRVDNNELNPVNAAGIYLYDVFGNLELIYRDAGISSMYPIPVRARTIPQVYPSEVDWDGPQEGALLVQDVYRGLEGVQRGSVKRLRVIGVPPKVQPRMNVPNLGVSAEDPGKFVLGTVPVDTDGSAYFRVPSGVPLFFQALDEAGLAVQTMRSLTYLQPGQTLSCVGCHEPRDAAPAVSGAPTAMRRAASKLTRGPEGSWPLRFDALVQPVLDASCVRCHNPAGVPEKARALDLTAAKAYNSLLQFADKDLHKAAFERDRSVVGDCTARQSRLWSTLTADGGHHEVMLTEDDLSRLATWMDVYAQRQGSFSSKQEEQLKQFKAEMAGLLEN